MHCMLNSFKQPKEEDEKNAKKKRFSPPEVLQWKPV